MLRAQLPLETPTDSDAAAGPVATDGAGRFGGVGVAADAIAAAGRLSGVDMCRGSMMGRWAQADVGKAGTLLAPKPLCIASGLQPACGIEVW